MKTSFKLEDKEHELSATLTTYASGDGSLSFGYVGQRIDCYGNRATLATGDKVTSRDVEYYIKHRKPELASWRVFYQQGNYKLYQPVTRITHDEVNFKGRPYRIVSGGVDNSLLEVYTLDDERRRVLNINIVGAIRFFLNHESELQNEQANS